jgi:RecB family exonuclease
VVIGQVTVRGVIDRIDAADGGHRVIDYKSGAPLPLGDLRRHLQVAIYALAARSLLGSCGLELELVYLRDGARQRVEATPETLDQAREAICQVAGAVAARRFEPAPEMWRCRSCPYRLVCDSAL